MEKKRILYLILIITIFVCCIIIFLLYYKGKYEVRFETGTNDTILTQYVERNKKIKKPIDPIKEGYIFQEWQCNGKKYNFNTKIQKNTTLTAKWLKEEYIKIKFVTNSDENIESIKILKGKKTDLPEATKEGYNFVGWSLNDNLVIDSSFNNDVILTAVYENDKINTLYKVNDEVIISGVYASSSKDKNAYNKRAIGWTRKILAIDETKEFPYVIGNSDGVTGYFKASSIKK